MRIPAVVSRSLSAIGTPWNGASAGAPAFSLRLGERLLGADRHERAELRIEPLDPLEVGLDELDRRDLALPDEARLLGRREERRARPRAQPTCLETPARPRSGASRRPRSRRRAPSRRASAWVRPGLSAARHGRRPRPRAACRFDLERASSGGDADRDPAEEGVDGEVGAGRQRRLAQVERDAAVPGEHRAAAERRSLGSSGRSRRRPRPAPSSSLASSPRLGTARLSERRRCHEAGDGADGRQRELHGSGAPTSQWSQ